MVARLNVHNQQAYILVHTVSQWADYLQYHTGNKYDEHDNRVQKLPQEYPKTD